MYKAMLRQVSEKMPKMVIGEGILAAEFDSIDEAKKVAASYLLTPKSTFQIREYDESKKVNIISFNAQDTGKVVFQSEATV